ncbi:MAG: hypothetical protein ABI330_20865 [Caldimonas sp.]
MKWLPLIFVFSVVIGAAPPARAQTPPVPPLGATLHPWVQKVYPRLPHEEFPDRWPQPDYVAWALTLTHEKVTEGAASIRRRNVPSQQAPRYVVMPVQTQAFGFAPAFVALVGASFDSILRRMSVPATQQTDFLDGYGPFVRRFDDAANRDFAVAYPGKEVVSLFIGHDGASQAFVDLSVGAEATGHHAHRTINLPDEPLQALDAISKVLPQMIGEVGLAAGTSAKKPPPGAFGCKSDTWMLAGDAVQSETERACRAFAIGTLLPDFDLDTVSLGAMDSPAKLAWLAQAYVAATEDATTSPDAKRIRDLSLQQLRYFKADPDAIASPESTDPVIRPLAALLSLGARTKQAPVRSGRELRETLIARESADLPPFAQALFVARAQYGDTFTGLDFCTIEYAFPGLLMRKECGNNSDPAAATRSASSAQALLYQEWRIASSFKHLVYEGVAQGRGEQTRQAIAALPTDLADHPFIRRLRMLLFATLRPPLGESFDGLMAQARLESLAFVQSTVDLQRKDSWTAAYSLSEHSPVVQNPNLHSEPQLSEATAAESRLLAVMSFDRFVTGAFNPPTRRADGDLAWFMGPMAPFGGRIPPFLAGRRIGPAASAASAPAFAASFAARPLAGSVALKPGAPFVPFIVPLFGQSPVNSFGMTRSQMEPVLASHPESMELRARIAIARLKEGESVDDVVKFFNEQPADERIDHALSQSHLWATPAHVFYLSGETAAARPFYQKVREIGTGSDSDLMARVRVALIDGKLDMATEASRTRLRRYNGDFTRRDLVGLQFVARQADAAWSTFLESASTSGLLELWDAAMTGHRLAGLDLAAVKRWLVERNLGKVQLGDADMSSLYLHRLAVTDRIPSLSDIDFLLDQPGPLNFANKRWAMSAVLARGAMSEEEPSKVLDRFMELRKADSEASAAFMLPLYAWIAGRAQSGDKRVIEALQKIDIESDFDHLLAKSLLLSARGESKESARFLRAARYELAQRTWGSNGLSGRPVEASYEYARAVFLMYRQTKDPALRQDALTFARANAQAWPYLGWSYGLLALVESDPKQRAMAICRARFLDPKSFFLLVAEHAEPERKGAARCSAKLW